MVYSWIWENIDLSKDPPVVRLMDEKDKPKRIWIIKSIKGGKTWQKNYHFMI